MTTETATFTTAASHSRHLDPAKPSYTRMPTAKGYTEVRQLLDDCNAEASSSRLATAPAASSDRPFRCTHPGCGASFPKSAKLDRHMRSHSDERPFVCQHPGCDASYKRNEHLKVHQRRHKDDSQRSFHCSEPGCGMSFWTSSHLKNHVSSVHRDEIVRVGTKDLYIPAKGEDGYSSRGTSPDKDAQVPLTEYRCTEPGCSESFHKRKVLRKHIREAHSDAAVSQALQAAKQPGNGSAVAPTQDVADVDDAELARRILLPFPCSHPGCEMRFPTNAKRRSHFKTHEVGRYSCSMPHDEPQQLDGQAGSSSSSSLTGSDAGQSCSDHNIYLFPNWSALQEHMKQYHPPTCPWPGCGKSFNRQDNLRAHYKRHEKRVMDLESQARLLMSPGASSSTTSRGRLRGGSSDDDDEDGDDYSSGSSSDDDAWRPSRSRSRSDGSASPSTSLPPDLESADFEALAADLSKNRPRRSSRLSTPDHSLASIQGDSPIHPRPLEDGAKFVCTWNGCGLSYTRRTALSIHIRTKHLGERPFECPGCKRKFAHKHLVTRHRRTCAAMGPLAALRGAQLDKAKSGSGSAQPLSSGGANDGDETPEATVSGVSTPQSADEVGEGQRSGTPDSPDDEEMTDDYFRREGGAVPESDAEREHAPQSRHVASAPANSAMRTRLLDLLTGRGYLGEGSERPAAATSQDEDGSERPAKRRRTRDRVFECPWRSIVEALSKEAAPTAPCQGGAPSSPILASADREGPAPTCAYSFSRIYDLRRHLKASHGLELDDREIRAWLSTRSDAPAPAPSVL